MRTALRRLLARPSVLRALRSLITQEDLSFAALSQLHHRAARPEASRRLESSCPRVHTPSSDLRRKHGLQKRGLGTDNDSPSAAESNASAKLPTNPAEIPLDQWVEILHFQQRLYGNDGVRFVWEELRKGGVDLPTTGQWAQPLWETFLANDGIVEDVVAYAEDLNSRTKFYYEPMYETVIGQCFVERRHPDVYRWHVKLASSFPAREGALRRIAPKIEGSKTSISAFRYLYRRNHQRDVYDALITTLCKQHRWSMALHCHKMLIHKGDLPSGTAMDSSWAGLWKALLTTSEHWPAQAEFSTDGQIQPKVKFSRETMNRVLGEIHGVQPKKLDDHFCARIFATKAFSIDVIIRGLGMFGVEELGPVALREMASRTVDAGKIRYNIERLNEAGIYIGNSVYSQAILKFAEHGRQDLINSLLSTDQHPDAFEDTALQRKLLTSFIERGDWNEAHRTLAILTIFHQDPVKEQWNILVQKISTLRDVPRLCKILEDMLSQKLPLTEESMSALQAYQLRPRRRGRRPMMRGPGYNDTTLIANIWRSTLVSGGYVDHRRWTEMFRRFGMTERFEDVVRLSLWLADWYSPESPANNSASLKQMLQQKRPRSSIMHSAIKSTHPRHPLRKIFPDQQIRAFIAWGIRRAFITPNPTDPETSKKLPHFWAQGLRLCRALRQRGVYIDTRVVRAALRLQLVHIFGHGRSTRAYNRRSVANNPYSALQMIEYANEVWMDAAGKALLDPRELVSGRTSHYGMWWLKRLRWDVLQQVDVALGVRKMASLSQTDDQSAMAQEEDEEVNEFGEITGNFRSTKDNESGSFSKSGENDADHMSVLGFRLEPPP